MRNQILVLGLSILLLLAVAACGEPEYNGTVLPEPIAAPDFTLTAAGDESVSLSDYRGEVVLLYFGYTFCPDICPATMAELGRIQAELDDAGEEMQVIMITVDPERDTPQVLADYVSHFHPTFIGLSGTQEEIDAVVSDFGVYYEKHEGTAASGYLVDHTARVFVVDREGDYWLSFPFGMEREAMQSDLRTLLRQ